MKKARDKFEPLKIDLENIEDEKKLIEAMVNTNKNALHKKIVEGIEYSIKKRLPKIIHAEGYMNGTLVLLVSMNSDDYGFHLEKSLKVLEELEEYEYCSKIVQLKELLVGFKPKKPRKKRTPGSLNEAIKSL